MEPEEVSFQTAAEVQERVCSSKCIPQFWGKDGEGLEVCGTPGQRSTTKALSPPAPRTRECTSHCSENCRFAPGLPPQSENSPSGSISVHSTYSTNLGSLDRMFRQMACAVMTETHCDVVDLIFDIILQTVKVHNLSFHVITILKLDHNRPKAYRKGPLNIDNILTPSCMLLLLVLNPAIPIFYLKKVISTHTHTVQSELPLTPHLGRHSPEFCSVSLSAVPWIVLQTPSSLSSV